MPTQTKTLANGEVWELRSGACDWHMTSPADVTRSQQEAYTRSILPNRPGGFGSQITPERQ